MAVVQLIPLGNYSRVNFILEEMGTLGMKRRKWEPSVHLLPLTALTVSLLRAPPTSGLTQAPHTEPLPLKVKRNCHSKASRCAVRGEIERKLCLLSEWGFEPDPDTHTALRLCKHCNWRAEDSMLLECVGLLSRPFPSWKPECWFANAWRKRERRKVKQQHREPYRCSVCRNVFGLSVL